MTLLLVSDEGLERSACLLMAEAIEHQGQRCITAGPPLQGNQPLGTPSPQLCIDLQDLPGEVKQAQQRADTDRPGHQHFKKHGFEARSRPSMARPFSADVIQTHWLVIRFRDPGLQQQPEAPGRIGQLHLQIIMSGDPRWQRPVLKKRDRVPVKTSA